METGEQIRVKGEDLAKMLYKRTHMCGELKFLDEGKHVTLNGWVAKARSLGSLVFVDLRDKSGITQVTFNEDAPAEIIEMAKSLRSEFCIGVKGVVYERSSKNASTFRQVTSKFLQKIS